MHSMWERKIISAAYLINHKTFLNFIKIHNLDDIFWLFVYLPSLIRQFVHIEQGLTRPVRMTVHQLLRVCPEIKMSNKQSWCRWWRQRHGPFLDRVQWPDLYQVCVAWNHSLTFTLLKIMCIYKLATINESLKYNGILIQTTKWLLNNLLFSLICGKRKWYNINIFSQRSLNWNPELICNNKSVPQLY